MAVASSAAELIFSARGDTDHARKEFKDFKKEVKDLKDEAQSTSGGFDKLAHSAGLSASQFTSLTGIATAAGAGILAVTAVAVSASLALFNLSKAAAEFGGEIFDAHEKTGLSTESLSAMKFAADQSGTSLDAITGATAKFAKTLGEAARGSGSAQEKLARLGVTSTDTDTAFKQALRTIAAAPAGYRQMALAQDAFGKSGAELLPFIKSFEGDLDGLIKKASELGLTLSKEDAAAADEFGDQLDTLSAQLGAAGRAIGFAFMPLFNDMAKGISNFLAENKDSMRDWASDVAFTIRGIILQWQAAKQAADDYHASSMLGQIGRANPFYQVGAAIGADARRRARDAAPPGATAGQPVTLRPDMTIGPAEVVGRASDHDAAEDERLKSAEREKAHREQLAAQERLNKAQKESVEQAYAELQAITKKNYEDRARTAEQFNADFIENERQFTARLIQLTQESFARQLAEAKNADDRKAIELEERNAIEKINADSRKRLEAANDLTTKNEKRAADERVKIREDAAKKEIAVLRAISETQLANLREQKDLGAITARQMIEMAGIERKSVLESTLARTTDAAQRKIIQEEINQQVIKNREDLRNYDKEEKERHENAKKRWKAYIDHLVDVKEKEDELEKRRAEAAERERIEQEQKQFNQIGGGVLGGLFGELGLSVEDMLKPVEILTNLGQKLAGVFQQVAQGVGAAVRSFVLFGTAGTSFRKFAAEVLASLAQMAVVQALFELAQGFAMLALGWFTGNAKYYKSAADHFIAAAVFGIIGGVAAIAGRAVAGNSFKNETSGGFGSAGGGGDGRNTNTGQQGRHYSSFGDEVTIVESGINQAAPASRVTLDIRPTDAFIVEVVHDNITGNGKLRTTVQDA